MNLPFSFALDTSTAPYGRVFEYTTTTGNYVRNATLYGVANAAGLGASAAARLAKAGLVTPARTLGFAVTGLSVTAWYSADVGAKVDFGVYDTDATAFIPLYEILSTGVSGGGIQKTFAKGENGIWVPAGATLIPCFRATKQTATDGAVALAGDISIWVEPRGA